MTLLVVMLAALIKLQWSIDHDLDRWNSCAWNYQNDLHSCAVQYPDGESLERRLCEAEARGRYSGCLEPWN